MSVGTARLSPILTRARSAAMRVLLARDLIGSGFSTALMSGSTASGVLHLAEHARGDRRAVEVVVGVVERRDEERLRARSSL